MRKDWEGRKFDRLTAVEFAERRGRATYWIFECDCGTRISRIPNYVRKNKYNACSECLRGSGAGWAWQGVGKFPQSHFRRIYHSAQAKNFEFSVTAEYLWKLYLEQEGRCAFTDWEIQFSETYDNKASQTASLDRIDSTLGYIEGNVQWVHKDVNKLKKNMTDSRFIELCIAVSKKNRKEK